MPINIETVEAILRKHWEMPSNINPKKLSDQAFKIQVMVGQKYSHQNLKYQLSLIQKKELQLNFDDQSCDEIASDLLRVVKA
ncbi:MAG: hypothetical protein ACLPPF_05145 [Rhodomicrobium sp.]